MRFRKAYILILLATFFLTGCSKKISTKPSTNKHKSTNKGITAIDAWQKIKPEADKWSQNYKITQIRDISVADTQRIDGRSFGWQFYLEDCSQYYTGSMSNLCRTGKSKTFYFRSGKMVAEPAGVTADKQTNMPSGRTAFEAEKLKIDSDKAQNLARKAVGRSRNKNEEFVMTAYSKGGIAYWQVRRQCWIKGNRDHCDSHNGYSVYVNLETGETYDKEPKN
ncbi:hypothetical protein DRH14_01665 [Candidatus Shapirobacteria bacterium]|nr:MAG: hypothetical protein DRH14_01665 [Candidatus Shapirobacteria bacterium]